MFNFQLHFLSHFLGEASVEFDFTNPHVLSAAGFAEVSTALACWGHADRTIWGVDISNYMPLQVKVEQQDLFSGHHPLDQMVSPNGPSIFTSKIEKLMSKASVQCQRHIGRFCPSQPGSKRYDTSNQQFSIDRYIIHTHLPYIFKQSLHHTDHWKGAAPAHDQEARLAPQLNQPYFRQACRSGWPGHMELYFLTHVP